jgi:hypothetical protein
MDRPIRYVAFVVSLLAAGMSTRAGADYGGPDGYGHSAASAVDDSRDGYPQDAQVDDTADLTNYVVIDAEDGTKEQVDGQTVIVVQEPEPVAATSEAPPPPRTVVVDQSVTACADGIWVDGYWGYVNGQYVWVGGHCVVERVNYVFVQPRWDFYANVWWFVPGYYRPCSAYVAFGYYRPWQWYPPYYYPYYRTRYPVPVYRPAPYRPTTVQPAPARRRTYVPPARPGRVTSSRTSSSPSRSPAVVRRPTSNPARTGTVPRVGRSPSRHSPVPRVGRSPSRHSPVPRVVRSPSRTSPVPRVGPSPNRTGTVARAPGRGAVGRTVVSRPAPSSSTRTPPVIRTPPTPTSPAARSSATRTSPVVRGASGPTLTNAAPRSSVPRGPIVSRPPTKHTRTGAAPRAGTSSVRGRGWGRSGSGSVRTPSVNRRPSGSSSRGSVFGRSGSSSPRSGFGGRGGGFRGPSSRGFGGTRSVPTARGR